MASSIWRAWRVLVLEERRDSDLKPIKQIELQKKKMWFRVILECLLKTKHNIFFLPIQKVLRLAIIYPRVDYSYNPLLLSWNGKRRWRESSRTFPGQCYVNCHNVQNGVIWEWVINDEKRLHSWLTQARVTSLQLAEQVREGTLEIRFP